MVDICRLVEGMPLAIELAAAWTALLEPAEILSEIRSDLDFLASDAANVPARQRSLPVVLDASWQLLSAAEREGVRKLSVFRGGFTGEVACQIAEVSSATLPQYPCSHLSRRLDADDRTLLKISDIAVRTRSGPHAVVRVHTGFAASHEQTIRLPFPGGG